ncbi:glycosyltransferase family 2 protein [Trichocoleus sp. FACHB-591]|uniref:glycosyltransferase family 2 protein n=1 Tax=Trichocoleus sp. FACHB-591 TaxID=2692872 RepID=UPI0018EF8AFD|nr:glycosyltransferase family 2 protein [Trichocoleus sp. FACHB-591]
MIINQSFNQAAKMSRCQETDTPLVSVIIPAYNAEHFIAKTLESVINQTYKSIEVLVVDDGSSDRTAEIVNQISQNDSRIVLLQQSNLGVAAARNLAIQTAKGEFIAPIDADDIWYRTNLEKQVCCLLQAPASVGLVYSWSADIDEADWQTGEYRASLIEGSVFRTLLCHYFLGNASSTLIRRSCLERVGNYNCNFKQQNAQGCEDWDLYLRIAEHYQFRVVPEFLVGYRKLPASMSRDFTSMAKSHALMLRAIRQKYSDIPALIYRLSSSSFYLYLARQSYQGKNYLASLFWLTAAFKIDFTTSLLRPGFYILLMMNFFGMITDSLATKCFRGARLTSSLRLNRKVVSTSPEFINSKADIRIKLLIERSLHRWMQGNQFNTSLDG